MSIFVSVVIPVYNATKYIENCVATLEEAFTDLDYEIILINDGSTDDSFAICEKLSYSNKNIKLITQANRGASDARNAGLSIATGEFIWFVDADDRIMPNVVGKIINNSNFSSYDVIAFNYQIKHHYNIQEVWLYKDVNEIDGITYLSQLKPSLYLWNKWFKRDVIADKRFLSGTKNIEDFLFCIDVLKDADKVFMLPIMGYEYNNLNLSSTSRNHSEGNLNKLSQDSMIVHKKLYEIINASDEIKAPVLSNLLNASVAGHLYSLYRYYPASCAKNVIKEYRKLGLYPVPKSNNARSNKFLLLANRCSLFVLAIKIKAIFIKKSNKNI